MKNWIHTLRVHCDHPDCGEWAEYYGREIGTVRYGFRHAGWTVDASINKGEDFCPDHKPRETP